MIQFFGFFRIKIQNFGINEMRIVRNPLNNTHFPLIPYFEISWHKICIELRG